MWILLATFRMRAVLSSFGTVKMECCLLLRLSIQSILVKTTRLFAKMNVPHKLVVSPERDVWMRQGSGIRMIVLRSVILAQMVFRMVFSPLLLAWLVVMEH